MRQKIGSLVDIEDLTQESLLGIHKNLATYHPSRPLAPWISAIIRYKTIDYFRRLSKNNEHFIEDLPISVTNSILITNSSMEASPSDTDILKILNQLPENLAHILKKVFIENMTYIEIAKHENISEAAVRKRISRAYAEVKKVLEKDKEFPFGS